MFFGEHKTNDVILSHLITYLNDKDVKVKLAFFEATIQLSTFIGITSLELYILPLLVQTLTDADEFVVQKILQCLALFADAHLIRSPYIWELIKVVIKFAAHPNQWIRQTMFAFIATTVRQISPAETYCLLYPVLRPFLVCDLIDFTEPTLLACAKPPLSRSVFNLVVTWAQKARRSYYWKISHQRRNNIKEVNTSNGSSSVASSSTVLSESIALRYNGNTGSETALNNAHRIELSTEDEQWLIKLQSIGFKQNKDLWKINVLRDFIYNIAHTVHNKPHGIESLLGSNHDLHLSLSKLKIMPFNVFFDDSLPSRRGSAKTSLAITSGESTVGTSITRTTATALTPPTPIPVNRVKFATNGITSSRSSPSTGTITTMAYGEVETPGRLQSQTSTLATTLESHENNNSNNNSSYTGKDPYILQFLANFSLDLAEFVSVEFGPSITPKENISLHEKLPAGNGRKPHWKPTGVLVSNLHEHTAPITRLVVSPDHEFFVSASDDGYIKVWDTQRLESTVTSHAMLTYKFGDTQVKAMCLVEKYHVVVATGVDGWVKLLRIYVRPKTGKARGKYRKIEVINQYNVNKSSSGIEGEYASDVHTLKLEKRLLIVLITTDSRIIILDANTLCEINVMQNPPEHGWLTSSVVDKDGNWVLVGTSKGVLDLWDLRFQLLIKSWGISGGSVVYRLVLHPHHSAKWICVAGGSGQSEVTVWDIETSQCVEVYRGSGNSEAGKGYDPVSVIDTSDFKVSQLNAEEFDTELLSKDHIIKSSGHGVHTVFADTEFEYSAGSLEYSRRSFLISAGSDKITRLWDMSNIEASTIVNGLVTGAGKPIYTVSFPTSSMTFNTERLYVPHHKENEAKRPGKLPRASIISTEQRNNMRNHRDTIMDAVLLLSPYKMIVTGDRSGVIKVFY
ncbi:WD40 repeat-like protein [Nadsonia fulvescens var. elongata DSM 6958]|uniref:non-specific serine/threonine protein kinase n=1 Tax=Nadsonia fulvescens var. elongata DSM 6958 TaxID=857566 RepID=A0A1E3PNT5_9ASCO|nr:WD40 repeat-like protein [Nadsonia fulvescens var. elongata DSM 6958]